MMCNSKIFCAIIFIMKWKNLSKKKQAYIAAALALVGVLAWAFISAGVITHNFNRSQLTGAEDRQEAQINGIILTETKNDHKYWEIYGESGSYDSDNGVALLNNCIGNFFDENNEVSMSFESSKGSYSAERKQIILYQDTHIVIKDGTSLEADRVVWSGNDKPVTATGHVRITRNDEFLATAETVEISPDFNRFKIKGKTVSKMYDTKEKK